MLDFNEERVMTKQSAFVSIGDCNGAHMSRLVGIIRDKADSIIDVDDNMLEAMATGHGADAAYWECKWDVMFKTDEVEDIKVQCKLEGKYDRGQDTRWYLSVAVPYASVCPCSAEMTQQYGGIPHMQRAVAVVTGQMYSHMDLDEVLTFTISKVISAVELIPLPYMKREDELEWCQRAQKTNLFVEGAARAIADVMDTWFEDYTVVCTHFESIHEHNVVAVCRKGGELV
jgi:GTP cyclohydrolase I